ncbi:MAG: hypothetical protein EA401_00740 [Planctomycetota bacterium]|nr:MAG: hypothetical protein EA401_00740 [Planctomycetota bacterium]
MESQVLIFGAGKIANALAGVCSATSPVTLASRTRPKALDYPWLPITECLEKIEPDVIMIATAWPVAGAYEKAARKLPPEIPLLSAAKAASLSELQSLFGKRPMARFLCSVAVGDRESLRFYDDSSSPEAVKVLRSIIPGSRWMTVPQERFWRYGQLLACSAAHCATLHFLSESLECDDGERIFLHETLHEARRLLDLTEKSELGVLEESMTPNGNTERLCRTLFRQGDELVAEVLSRRQKSQPLKRMEK